MANRIEDLPLDPDTESGFEESAEMRAELRSRIEAMVQEAINWHDENLDPLQEEATRYYHGEPLGNEEAGRSQVVMTVVRDVVRAIRPSLCRLFFGSERSVEFKPRGPEDEAVARQMTDYVNYIVQEDNKGFLEFLAWFDDALIRKLGIVKFWHEDNSRTETARYTGLSGEQVEALEVQEDTQVEVLGSEGDSYDVEVTKIITDGRIRFATLPPEEFVWSPNARSLEDAHMCAHVRMVPADELIEMGVPENVVERSKGLARNASTFTGQLENARRIDRGGSRASEDEQDEATRPCQLAEVYARIDVDGDNIAELRKFECVGPQYEIVNGDGYGEKVDEKPFALLCPDPEAHSFIGHSYADLVMDLQRINSAIARGMLDSLALSINPVTEVVEGEVDMGDVQNTEVGKIIRARKPGMVREVPHRFVGEDALPVLGYFDQVKEDRTGRSKAASGLDADALQSTTKAAVQATVSAAQEQVELIARIFAETGVKDLFKGLLRLVVRHQNKPRTVRLRNQWVEIDPSHWDATMDVKTNVALGSGMIEERMAMLRSIGEDQLQLMANGSPLVDWARIRATRQRVVELSGFTNSDEFYKPWTPEQEAQMQQAQAMQPPPEDPAITIAKMQTQIEMAKIAAQSEEARRKDEFERTKLAVDAKLKELDLELKYKTSIADSQLKNELERDRLELDAADLLEKVRQFDETPDTPVGASA